MEHERRHGPAQRAGQQVGGPGDGPARALRCPRQAPPRSGSPADAPPARRRPGALERTLLVCELQLPGQHVLDTFTHHLVLAPLMVAAEDAGGRPQSCACRRPAAALPPPCRHPGPAALPPPGPRRPPCRRPGRAAARRGAPPEPAPVTRSAPRAACRRSRQQVQPGPAAEAAAAAGLPREGGRAGPRAAAGPRPGRRAVPAAAAAAAGPRRHAAPLPQHQQAGQRQAHPWVSAGPARPPAFTAAALPCRRRARCGGCADPGPPARPPPAFLQADRGPPAPDQPDQAHVPAVGGHGSHLAAPGRAAARGLVSGSPQPPHRRHHTGPPAAPRAIAPADAPRPAPASPRAARSPCLRWRRASGGGRCRPSSSATWSSPPAGCACPQRT
jgi:hypothetical protein